MRIYGERLEEVNRPHQFSVWCPDCGDSMTQFEHWERNRKYIQNHLYYCLGCDSFFDLQPIKTPSAKDGNSTHKKEVKSDKQ